MKTIMLSLTLAAAVAAPGFAQAKTVTVAAIPASMDEMTSLRDKIATTPEGGAVSFITAMIVYGSNHKLGLQALTLTLDAGQLSAGTVYKGFKPKRAWYEKLSQIDKFPFLGKIYVEGTSAEEGYVLPEAPYTITVTEVRLLPKDTAKAFVASTGGNLPRPVSLARNSKGIWKVTEASSLFVGPSALPPEEKQPDDL
ncbi:MAG: hypothetical protein JXD23_15120 [Spirochaetales bacterium]|nr:hypothetical protein [Spirochaetales bacterium]